MGKIYQIYGQDAHEMTLKLLTAADAIRLVPAGGSVALKPNLVIAGTPESGSTTHPGVLSGCIAYFREHGVRDISVIEGSWVGDDTMRAMRRAGYDQVCKTWSVPFYDLKKDPEEMHNIYGQPGTEKITAALKKELLRLQVQYNDPIRNTQYAK